MSYLLSPPVTPNLDSPDTFACDQTWTRQLSNNELSYFLPSRAAGVNDMYLHHNLKTTQPELLSRERVTAIWAILRARHPLLASKVVKGFGQEMDDWQFSYKNPANVREALSLASATFDSFVAQSGEDIISRYLNGPRQLAQDRLAKIVLSFRPSSSDASETEFDFMLATTHFVGDGMALHAFASQFWTLVGTGGDMTELLGTLEKETHFRLSSASNPLPLSSEDRLLPPPRINPTAHRALSKAAFKASSDKAIGGQALPKVKASAVETVVPTRYWSAEETKRVMKRCKDEGISFTHAVFALVNLGWISLGEQGVVAVDAREPMMMYSALSLRSSMAPLPVSTSPIEPSFFHLSLGYFNIVLPSFRFTPSSSPSASSTRTFFARARATKAQTLKAIKSKLLVGKSMAEMEERATRAVRWAIMDDAAAATVTAAKTPSQVSPPMTPRKRQHEDIDATPLKAAGAMIGLGISLLTPPSSPPVPLSTLDQSSAQQPSLPSFPAPKPVANGPLIGLSILGNLDQVYAHDKFGPISLEGLTTGSRQRSGASLLFGYIFKNQMVLSLGYDRNGHREGVMDALWSELSKGVQDILLA